MTSPRRRGIAPTILALCSLVSLLAATPSAAVPASSSPKAPIPGEQLQDPNSLRRWFGAESGFEEVACGGVEVGCESFTSVTSFDGQVASRKSNYGVTDATGATKTIQARTGSRLFVVSVPGGMPSVAHLSTLGALASPSSPLTMSFSIRYEWAPVQPVVIYRHQGAGLEQTIMLTLTTEGRLAVSSGGRVLGLSAQPLTIGQWNDITITYGTKRARLELYVNGRHDVSEPLASDGPAGELDVGIVSPLPVRFSLGIDDIVEVGAFDAPIRGARVNYLMPLGTGELSMWSKSYPDAVCKAAAHNWQFVSEDQSVSVPEIEPGIPGTCQLGGGALRTGLPNQVDEYLLEGIPSRHKPSSGYPRNVLLQPDADDAVLGVRLRLSGHTTGPPTTWLLSLRDAGSTSTQAFEFDDGGGGGSQTSWGETWERRVSGFPWDAPSLDAVRVRLHSGSSPVGERWATAVRLDYVWVPS